MRIFSIFALAAAAVAALSSAASLVSRTVDFAFSFMPTMLRASPALAFDNSHPRSPLASIRAGLA